MLRYSHQYLSRHLRIYLIKTLIVTKILFCSSIYSGCSNKTWSKLRVCFNDCIRFAFDKNRRENVEIEVEEVLGCSLNVFLDFHSTIQVHKLLSGNGPEYLIEKLEFPRRPRNRMLTFPYHNNTKQRINSFFIRGIKAWNDLKSNQQNEKSLANFKRTYLENTQLNK